MTIEEKSLFKTHLVEAMYELIQGADFAEIMSKMEKSDSGGIGGISGVLMKSAVQAFAPSLPKYLHKLDTNPEAQRNLAAIMRHLVTAADKDEAEEERHDTRDSEEGAAEGTAGAPEPGADSPDNGGSEQDAAVPKASSADGSAREDEARND